MQAAVLGQVAMSSSLPMQFRHGCSGHCSSSARRVVNVTLKRRPVVTVAALDEPERSSAPQPVPLSLFTPYKGLPPNGQIIPPAEEHCQVEVSNCKTLSYVFEDKCTACYGTGLARGRVGSRARAGRGGRTGSLRTCLVCTGIGYVRRTTSRQAPEFEGDISEVTLARKQKLPGEPEQQQAAPMPQPPETSRWNRLRKAKELFDKITGHSSESKPESTNGNGNGAVTRDGDKQQPSTQNNIISSNGRFSPQATKAEAARSAGKQ